MTLAPHSLGSPLCCLGIVVLWVVRCGFLATAVQMDYKDQDARRPHLPAPPLPEIASEWPQGREGGVLVTPARRPPMAAEVGGLGKPGTQGPPRLAADREGGCSVFSGTVMAVLLLAGLPLRQRSRSSWHGEL